MIEKCNILEEEIINSIENWIDILPEVADFTTQIGLISELKMSREALEKDISNLNQHMATMKEDGSKQKQELEKKLSEKEIDLTETKKNYLS